MSHDRVEVLCQSCSSPENSATALAFDPTGFAQHLQGDQTNSGIAADVIASRPESDAEPSDGVLDSENEGNIENKAETQAAASTSSARASHVQQTPSSIDNPAHNP